MAVQIRPKIETVFESREKEVYRIPALFYDRDNKILMAFAEKRRTSNDNSSVALVMATRTLEKDETTDEVTTKWSEMKLVSEAQLCGYRPMNPCPVYEKTSKTLFLFFICVKCTFSEQWQRRSGCNKARLCYVTTNNAGQSWSHVTDLTDQLSEIKQWATFAVGPGHGLQTKTNRMIVPVYAYASRSHSCCIGCFRTEPYALALCSDDMGKTWHFGNMLKNVSLECEMAEFIDDKNKSIIYCNARTKGGYREEAVSENNGEDFSQLSSAKKLEETANGCHGSIVSFPVQNEAEDTEGNQNQSPNKWLLFTHPKKESREDLGVYLNTSLGERNVNAWNGPWVINKGPSGYSDVAYIDDGCFACLMECGVHSEIEQIGCMLFSYNHVKQGIGE